MFTLFQIRRIFKNLPKSLCVFLKNIARHCKISFETINFPSEIIVHIGHISPTFNFVEKLGKTITTKKYYTKKITISSTYLKLQCLKRLVKLTQFPSTKACPTVGVIVSRHATKTAQPSQCNGSPFSKKYTYNYLP